MTTINNVAMGCKPDPYKFRLSRVRWENGNTIVLANYEGCKQFGGDKLILLKGNYPVSELKVLDPHFIEENNHAVIARFIPNDDGWDMAVLCAQSVK